MKKISNDFVTIEYENDKQELIAKYYLKQFEKNIEFYKGILNGKDTIHANELINIPIDVLIIDEIDQETDDRITKSILEFSNIKNVSFYAPNGMDLLLDVNMIITNGYTSEAEVLTVYEDLAYNYFLKTKDFTYMKKYLFDNDIRGEDIRTLCDFTVLNNIDDLLKSRLYLTKIEMDKNRIIFDNLENIISIVYHTYDGIQANFTELLNSIDIKGINPNYLPESGIIPAIDDDQFEELVRDAIKYIDPTNELLEEYIELKKENRLELVPLDAAEGDKSCFIYIPEINEYRLVLSTTGTIVDVVGLLHELGHLHYAFIDKEKRHPNILFDEYPSIYFELKTAEFLKQKGYTDKEISLAKYFRTCNNLNDLIYLFPTLVGLYNNRDKEVKDYDISNIKYLVDRIDKLDPASFEAQGYTKEEAEETIKQTKLGQCYMLISPSETTLFSSLYLIGTFFSEYALKNMQHEDVLDILQKIRLNPNSIYNIIKMHGLDPSKFDIKDDIEKAKEKKIGTKKDDE